MTGGVIDITAEQQQAQQQAQQQTQQQAQQQAQVHAQAYQAQQPPPPQQQPIQMQPHKRSRYDHEEGETTPTSGEQQ
jgi:mediator of RNA polymerase II transcription subunit 15